MEDTTNPTPDEARGLGRRTVIKGAAAGVIGAWAVPVVTSLTSPAFAAGSRENPNPECVGATCTTFVNCSSSNPDCVCTTTGSGGGFCVPGSTSCGAGSGACGPGNTCPPGETCLVDTCCGQPVCIPTALNANCPPDASGQASGAAVRVSSGPGTLGG